MFYSLIMLHFFIHLPPIGHIKLETPDEWRCAAVARQVRQGSRRCEGRAFHCMLGHASLKTTFGSTLDEYFCWKETSGMFKPPFASFGRRGAATSSATAEPRAFAPDPLGSPAAAAAPLLSLETLETPSHQSKKSNINDTYTPCAPSPRRRTHCAACSYSDSFSSPKSDFDQESPVPASNSKFLSSALALSHGALAGPASDAKDPAASLSRESSFNDSADLVSCPALPPKLFGAKFTPAQVICSGYSRR